MATCPFCHRGSLRIIAAITHESVITRILRHCKLASVPPPIAPARCRQEIFAFDEAHASVAHRRRARSGRVFRPFAPVQCRLKSSSPQLFRPGRPEGLAPGNPSDAPLPHPEPPVQAARRRATPCCAPLRQAAAIAASEQRPPAGDSAMPQELRKVLSGGRRQYWTNASHGKISATLPKSLQQSARL